MHCPISRRDFLNGAALTIGGAAIRPSVLSSLAGDEDVPEKSLNYYPPALTGMRGNHDGSFASAHHLRDAQKWDASGGPESTGEFYDLVVVGGGISGLAAAIPSSRSNSRACARSCAARWIRGTRASDSAGGGATSGASARRYWSTA